MSTVAERAPALQRGILIEWFSIVWMVLEAAVAIVAGVLAHSVALVAYGADSVIELVAGVAVLSRLYVETRGGDDERVERAEKAASWVVGVALLALALYIVVASIISLISRSRPETSALGIGIAAASSVLMPVLATAKKSVGQSCSKALVSDGSCSMVCAYMSWILLVGVGATALLGWWWIDTIAALGFVWFVVREGLEAVKEARETESYEGE
jgi:divalent metal cation (Fe/Co/Zn/Cd) transporter